MVMLFRGNPVELEGETLFQDFQGKPSVKGTPLLFYGEMWGAHGLRGNPVDELVRER